jgi:hypothetical protein
MKRTGFVRPDSRQVLVTSFKKTPMKVRRQPQTKIRASAREQECTLQFTGVCNGRTDTTVLCHSNQLADGKGMGLKAPDTRAAYGCCACHDVFDGRSPRPEGMTYDSMLVLFERGVTATHAVLSRLGLMAVGGNSTENGTVPFFPNASEAGETDEH